MTVVFYICTQLHQGVGGSTMFVNYAVWESAAAFAAAFHNPQFKETAKQFPASVIALPHLIRKTPCQGIASLDRATRARFLRMLKRARCSIDNHGLGLEAPDIGRTETAESYSHRLSVSTHLPRATMWSRTHCPLAGAEYATASVRLTSWKRPSCYSAFMAVASTLLIAGPEVISRAVRL